uniref:Uncharacterized protein n=1 Tax=Anguilla anguilla TaxID=7936 RepID=A0A0E9W4C4_ANGAN
MSFPDTRGTHVLGGKGLSVCLRSSAEKSCRLLGLYQQFSSLHLYGCLFVCLFVCNGYYRIVSAVNFIKGLQGLDLSVLLWIKHFPS